MQLHFYLPDDVADQVKKRAEARGISVSRYVAELVRREVATGWPEGFFEGVVGRWEGDLKRAPRLDYEARDDL